ncbi:MAG: hypothetical protein KAJ20_03795 [Candidatus Aenigmarchaeota archaeon]|nr:hypothetical protein [Candidatus Aenigmarchaeota archaeon]MCK5373436.1 hypothetical protein [Candidatus Aenigmarchaeota archaeon]
MGAGILSRVHAQDDIRQKQLDRQRVVNKFLEKRRDKCGLSCEHYFFLVILDRDLKVYEPEYDIFYRLRLVESNDKNNYKEGDYVLFSKVGEDYRPELEDDGIESEVYILQDVDNGTELKAHMFSSDTVYSSLVQIYKDKIIYARMLMKEMKEKMNSDSEKDTGASIMQIVQ